jgi:hypothetical protein
MNHFAIIPLAILANACASQADIEAMADDAEADIRELLEQTDGDAERTALSDHRVRQRVIRRTVKQFEHITDVEDCTIEGVAIADWRDRSFEYLGMVMSLDAKPIATITGRITYDDNNSGGVFGSEIHTSGDINSLTIEGRWLDSHIDADVIIGHTDALNNDKLTLFATRKQRGLSGHFVGVLANCR